MSTLFLKLTKIYSNGETAISSIAATPLRFDDSSPKKAFEYLQIIFIARNKSHWSTFLPLIVWPYICYFSHNYLWKLDPLSLKVLVRKPSLTRNSHWKSFQVIPFAISYKPARDCTMPYNNAAFISKVSEEAATENTETCRWQQPHCRLTSPSRGTPTNIRIYLIFPETRVIGQHLCCW